LVEHYAFWEAHDKPIATEQVTSLPKKNLTLRDMKPSWKFRGKRALPVANVANMTGITEKKLVLLVDDTPANIGVVHDILKNSCNIRIATNGVKALDFAKALPQPDLILLDVIMPDLDGYEVCSRLKSDPNTRDIPIIFLTGKTDVEDETRGFELGAADYIHKPFSPAVVQTRVHTQLMLREARERLAVEKRKLDHLLDDILPAAAVTEMKKTGSVVPRRFENVAVLFTYLVGFTTYCDQHTPEEVVSNLVGLFVAFEECARFHGLEKIKTIGDAFLATAGLLEPVVDPLRAAVSCALAISDAAGRSGRGWQVRSGVHIGPVIAGIAGRERYHFDIWGDTVNFAALLAGVASPGTVALTEKMSERLPGAAFSPRGAVELKGKGSVGMVDVSAITPGTLVTSTR
jgi:adenylate cyclase